MRSRRLVLSSAVALALVSMTGDSARADGARSSVVPRGVHQNAHGRWVRDLCDHTKKHFCLAEELLAPDWAPGKPLPQVHPPNPVGMAPTDVLTAYSIPSGSSSKGAVVAILDSPDSNAFSDLSAYRSQFGIPALPQCTSTDPIGPAPCFAQVGENGGPSTGQDSGQDGDGETGLDMDMISAACPDCSILLVEIGDPTNGPSSQDFITGAQTAATLGAVATSISFGGPESTDPTNGGGGGGMDPTGFTTAGHLVLAASGDFAFDNANIQGGPFASPSWPSSAPDIVAVGGTDLFNLGASSYGEAVWNDGTFSTGANGQDVTTSGCSTEYPMPSWQTTPLNGSGCSNRATADLSAAATFTSGGQEIAIASFSSGQWEQVEGTSASSPMVAGILARLGLAVTISNNLGWPYSHMSSFNDVGSTGYAVPQGGSTTDSNTSGCGILCTIGTGWDGPSGVGSPNGTQLEELGGGSSSGSGSGAGSLSGSGSSSGSGSGSGSSSGGVSTGTGSGGAASSGSSGGSSGSGSTGAASSGSSGGWTSSGSGAGGGTSSGSGGGWGAGTTSSGSGSSSGSGGNASAPFGGLPESDSSAGGCAVTSAPRSSEGGVVVALGIAGVLLSRRRRVRQG